MTEGTHYAYPTRSIRLFRLTERPPGAPSLHQAPAARGLLPLQASAFSDSWLSDDRHDLEVCRIPPARAEETRAASNPALWKWNGGAIESAEFELSTASPRHKARKERRHAPLACLLGCLPCGRRPGPRAHGLGGYPVPVQGESLARGVALSEFQVAM